MRLRCQKDLSSVSPSFPVIAVVLTTRETGQDTWGIAADKDGYGGARCSAKASVSTRGGRAKAAVMIVFGARKRVFGPAAKHRRAAVVRPALVAHAGRS